MGRLRQILAAEGLRVAEAQGNFYFFSPIPLSEFGSDRSLEVNLVWADNSTAMLPAQDREGYRKFLRQLASESFSGPRANYIYQLPGVAIFTGVERDFYRLIKAKAVDRDLATEKWGVASYRPETLARAMAALYDKEGSYPFFNSKLIDADKFAKMYDGVVTEMYSGTVGVFRDVVERGAKLVDGLILRTDPGDKTDVSFKLPPHVAAELKRYTASARTKMDPEIAEWLWKNSPKPYSKKTVYRAFGIPIDNDDIELARKRLKNFAGLADFTDVKDEGAITVQRGKESSWSANPVVAKNFASGEAMEAINFLVRADVDADDIILDFSELPISERKRFVFRGQAEVIVAKRAIKGKISEYWLDPGMDEWLESFGYRNIPKKGIVKTP